MKRKGILSVLCKVLLFALLVCMTACGAKKEESAPKKHEESSDDGTREVKEREKPGKEEAKEVEPASFSRTGALHVEGTKLKGSNGEAVQLRGISTHGMAWFPDYINGDCFAQLHNEWNANVIRLAMYTAEYGGYCTDGDKEYLKGLIRDGVRYATEQDMYVIIDWHILSDNNPNLYLEEAKAFFAEISKEYADADNVLYEICNEPNGDTTWGDIKTYAQEVIPVIRENAQEAVIIIGTPNWSQFVDQAAADPITEYENLMYTLHFYASTHKEDLRGRMAAAIDAGLPIFVTEYGICDASGNGAIDIEQANQWIELMNQYEVSYVAWNLSNKDESSAIFLSSCSKTSGFTEEDLSKTGKWLKQMLTKGTAGDGVDQSKEGEANQEQKPSSEGKDSQVFVCGNLEVTMYLKNSWEEENKPVHQYELTIKNTSEQECTKWEVDIPFEENISLTDGWNGEYSVKDGTVHISSKEYNGIIPAKGEAGDIGFIVKMGD